MTGADATVREVMVVQSKVRDLARRQELRLSDAFLQALNDRVHGLVEESARRCRANGRRTLDAADV